MATGGASEPEEATIVLPDWMVLVRRGRTHCHNGLDAARVAVNKNKTAAPVHMDGGLSCYVSFTTAAPQKGNSYLNLHLPEERPFTPATPPAYAHLRATDKDLVLFDITNPSQIQTCCWDPPSDLFVYTAGDPSPSVQRLPMYTKDRSRSFLMNNLTTGILRLAENRYIVADLNVYPKTKGKGMRAELCVFNSETGKWKVIRKLDPRNGGQFPELWSTDNVLAFDGRFLCWVDYLSGVLLCDFSKNIYSPSLCFVPFPGGNEYPDMVRVERYFPERFRSVSISQGKICFVHIDNDFHSRVHGRCRCRELRDRKKQGQQQQQTPKKITVWTLNSEFEWKLHHEINLDSLWAQAGFRDLHIDQRLPEFPIISVDDPDVLCCLLTEEEFLRGNAWMIMVDKHARLRHCESVGVEAYDNRFPDAPQIITVFSKYLERPAAQQKGKRKRKRNANR